jgi:hypothetical protein
MPSASLSISAGLKIYLVPAEINDFIVGKIWLLSVFRYENPTGIKKTGNRAAVWSKNTTRLRAGQSRSTAYEASAKGKEQKNRGPQTFRNTSARET